MLQKFKKLIALDNPLRLLYHLVRAIIANIYYGFPSKNMTIIWVTWTNGKTTTCNIIAKWLQKAGKKVFMFTTVNIIIWDKEYTNNTKMTSPDAFELQRLLKIAKKQGCEIAVIETASHGIAMHRIWWIEYDILALTNISQDHLDLHKTMQNYVNTKLSIFKKLISYKRKPGVKKIAIINNESEYSELFKNETYDQLYTYWIDIPASLKAKDIKHSIEKTSFLVDLPWDDIKIETSLIWEFNIYNILAAIWVFVSLNISKKDIANIIKEIKTIPWRMEEVENQDNLKIFIDYAHTEDALENVLTTLKKIEWVNQIITVFWATWDRDRTKRPKMWEVVSKLSDKVIVTQDDDYSEKTEDIIKDILPWIDRKQWEDFWIIPDREAAIRTAIIWGEKNDIILIAWKWDEHSMITNNWSIEWNDKNIVKNILEELDNNKTIK